jgi:hypothetical protein
MNSKLIVILVELAAIILPLLKVVFDVLPHLLGNRREEQVRTILERAQAGVRRGDAAYLCPRLFGLLPPVYSWLSAPWRAAKVSSLALFICLALGGIFSGSPAGMKLPPWSIFSTAVEILSQQSAKAAHNPTLQALPPHLAHFQQNIADLASLKGPTYATIFTVFFALTIFCVTILFFRASVGLALRILRDLVVQRDPFSRFLLLISTLVLVLCLATAEFAVLLLLTNIWIWPSVPALFDLLRMSVAGGLLACGFIGGIGTFILWDTWSRVVLFVSLAPCILLGFLILASLLAPPFKRPILALSSTFIGLALRSPKGPFPFLAVACAAMIICCSFLSWVARLQFGPLSERLMAVCGLFFLAMYLLARLRRRDPARASLGFSTAACLFIATECMVILGFFLQAILGCFLSRPLIPDEPFTLFLGGIIPGGVAACWLVRSYALRPNVLGAVPPLLVTLVGFDFVPTAMGLISYREFAFAFACDVVGAPFGALLLVLGHRWIRRPGTGQPPTSNRTEERVLIENRD